MRVVVADASALLELLLGTERGAAVSAIVSEPAVDLHVPSLCDVEVVSGLRRLVLRHLVTPRRAGDALGDYGDLPLVRHGHQALLPRIFELRRNLSAYDAAYVALAERLGAGLLTGDASLARAVGRHTRVVASPLSLC